MDTNSLIKDSETDNLWAKHLDGKYDGELAIPQKKESSPEMRELMEKHHELTKQKKAMIKAGESSEKIKKKDKDISEAKRRFFEHKQKMRVSVVQQRGISLTRRPISNSNRRSNPQRRAVR